MTSINEAQQPPPPPSPRYHPIITLLLQPLQWLSTLSTTFTPSFIYGVVLVYFLDHGFSGSYFRVVSDFYWKDVQKINPSHAQFFVGLYYIPWIMRPIWGLLTDVFPIMGYRRKPYFILSGIIGVFSTTVLMTDFTISSGLALVCMVGISAGMAIGVVSIDACIAKNSIEVKELAADLQSLSAFFASLGALVGFACSGIFVHRLGAQVGERVGKAMKNMYTTIRFPQVWKPSLFMFLSSALSYSTHEGHFYWYTDSNAGPGFSKEFVGMIYAIGAVGSIIGIMIYHKFLKEFPFRSLLFSIQLLYAASGMLDLMFILRWNLTLGIPDAFFIIMEETILHIISRIRWMPMLVLSARLCPSGIEGTFYALLMCIDSLGSLSAKMIGGLALHVLHVSRTDFTNLWLAVFIRNCLRFATLSLIFLIPDATQYDVLVPTTKSTSVTNIGVEDAALELLPLNEKLEI
ncbi:putative folate-biopterin transporter 6 isoform X2 [Silene latifolia]|uniref:putative folate-biopterin transporter 6 isoform X2 n=1 Tax=Silene latifolia TaxID=37657 RepID=UPI003D785A71